MRILVVEDDPASRRIVHLFLVRSGYDVAVADNGKTAWEMFQREPYSIVVTDWMMPELDGVELIKMIREADTPGYTYVIMLTAKTVNREIAAVLNVGADDYISKPFGPDEFLARVAVGARIVTLEANLSKTQRELVILSQQDGLTGLLNRRAIQAYAIKELAQAQHDPGLPVSYVLVDIDRFKDINDAHGHLVGDHVLQAVSQILNSRKKTYDWVGRWGGEEFLCVLPRTNLQIARLVAERTREAIANTQIRLPSGDELRLTASFGVSSTSEFPDAVPDFDSILGRADEALYRAKATGRNRVCVNVADEASQS